MRTIFSLYMGSRCDRATPRPDVFRIAGDAREPCGELPGDRCKRDKGCTKNYGCVLYVPGRVIICCDLP